jgi:hypothetical protein
MLSWASSWHAYCRVSGAWSSLSPHLAIAYAYAFQAREVQHLRELPFFAECSFK